MDNFKIMQLLEEKKESDTQKFLDEFKYELENRTWKSYRRLRMD